MNQKVLKTLEYNKIIHQLTGYAASAPGKLLCQNLLPMSDFHEIVQAQTETSDALTRVRMKGSLSLSGIRDVRDSLKRLEIGSALGIPELLSISSLLTVAARAKASFLQFLQSNSLTFSILFCKKYKAPLDNPYFDAVKLYWKT